MPMDPRERFTGTVERYAAFRPDYPDALFDWLAVLSPQGRRVADLGAGTGIFTRLLREHGWDVVGIEPNAAMRGKATGVRIVDGTAEATGLASASVDLVVGAQAFHWFDLARTLPELDRILVPRGRAVAVWNVRVAEGFAAAYDEVLVRFSPDYATVPKPGPTLDALRALRPGGVEVALPHGQVLDRDGVIGRAWSSSYVVHGVSDRPAFDAALMAAFDAHADGGTVTMGYTTVGYAWSAGPPPPSAERGR